MGQWGIYYRRRTYCINGGQLCEAIGKRRQDINVLITRWISEYEFVSEDSPWDGVYISYVTGLQICQLYGSRELSEFLDGLHLTQEKLPLEPEISVIRCDKVPISVRNDCYIKCDPYPKTIRTN